MAHLAEPSAEARWTIQQQELEFKSQQLALLQQRLQMYEDRQSSSYVPGLQSNSNPQIERLVMKIERQQMFLEAGRHMSHQTHSLVQEVLLAVRNNSRSLETLANKVSAIQPQTGHGAGFMLPFSQPHQPQVLYAQPYGYTAAYPPSWGPGYPAGAPNYVPHHGGLDGPGSPLPVANAVPVQGVTHTSAAGVAPIAPLAVPASSSGSAVTAPAAAQPSARAAGSSATSKPPSNSTAGLDRDSRRGRKDRSARSDKRKPSRIEWSWDGNLAGNKYPWGNQDAPPSNDGPEDVGDHERASTANRLRQLEQKAYRASKQRSRVAHASGSSTLDDVARLEAQAAQRAYRQRTQSTSRLNFASSNRESRAAVRSSSPKPAATRKRGASATGASAAAHPRTPHPESGTEPFPPSASAISAVSAISTLPDDVQAAVAERAAKKEEQATVNPFSRKHQRAVRVQKQRVAAAAAPVLPENKPTVSPTPTPIPPAAPPAGLDSAAAVIPPGVPTPAESPSKEEQPPTINPFSRKHQRTVRAQKQRMAVGVTPAPQVTGRAATAPAAPAIAAPAPATPVAPQGEPGTRDTRGGSVGAALESLPDDIRNAVAKSAVKKQEQPTVNPFSRKHQRAVRAQQQRMAAASAPASSTTDASEPKPAAVASSVAQKPVPATRAAAPSAGSPPPEAVSRVAKRNSAQGGPTKADPLGSKNQGTVRAQQQRIAGSALTSSAASPSAGKMPLQRSSATDRQSRRARVLQAQRSRMGSRGSSGGAESPTTQARRRRVLQAQRAKMAARKQNGAVSTASPPAQRQQAPSLDLAALQARANANARAFSISRSQPQSQPASGVDPLSNSINCGRSAPQPQVRNPSVQPTPERDPMSDSVSFLQMRAFQNFALSNEQEMPPDSGAHSGFTDEECSSSDMESHPAPFTDEDEGSGLESHPAPAFTDEEDDGSGMESHPAPGFTDEEDGGSSGLESHPAPGFTDEDHHEAGFESHPAPGFTDEEDEDGNDSHPAPGFTDSGSGLESHPHRGFTDEGESSGDALRELEAITARARANAGRDPQQNAVSTEAESESDLQRSLRDLLETARANADAGGEVYGEELAALNSFE